VADDLEVPWGIVFLPSGDALVGERGTGRLVRISAGGRLTTLGHVAGVAAPAGLGEGGLLGLALAPGDPDTLFAYLTSSSDNRVVRLSLAGGRVGRPRPVLTGIPTSTHHHGGRLLFAPDGALYVSTGDAEQPSLAQDRGSLAGKILRVRPDGRAAPGNPFGNRTWSYGHRNIEGLAFDSQGRLWEAELGNSVMDELNLIRPGHNYGWPACEGTAGACADPTFVAPVQTWPVAAASPSGLTIVGDTLYMAALRGTQLWRMTITGRDATTTTPPQPYFTGVYGRLRTVEASPDGGLWLTTSNGGDKDSIPNNSDSRILHVALGRRR
jgi:glucose/arabinose dehydrogenase